MERDRANLFVLEGVLAALILLGAAYAVQNLDTSSTENVRPRSDLELLTRDILVVLDGLEDVEGRPLLDEYVAGAYHCALDAAPLPTDCDGRRHRNFSFRLENYLPLGAGYSIQVGNAIDRNELYRTPLSGTEVVAAAVEFSPGWNLTFLMTEMSCYDAGVDINVTMIPIAQGNLSWARWGNVTIAGTEIVGERAFQANAWNATLSAATRPASGTIFANVTGNATLEGATAYTACAQSGQGAALRNAARGGSFSISAPRPPLGTTVSFDADITSIAGVAGVTIGAVDVSILEPLPASGTTPDTWVESDRIPLTGGLARTGTWTVPSASLYGKHVALLRVSVTIGGVPVELHRVTTFDVALPSGHVPIDPPYRIALQTWLGDWG